MFVRVFKAALLLTLIGIVAACSPNTANNNAANGANNAPAALAQAAPTATPIPTAPAVAKPTYLVQRGDVQNILDFTGRWQPRDQMTLSFEIAGTVRRVNVKQGDAVTAGQLLVDYQITDLENQLASAQLSLETAQKNLQNGATGDVQSVADAEVALANAKLNLESTKANSPWTSVASAKQQLISAQQGVDNAQRNYDDALSHPESPASTVDGAYQQLQSAKNSLISAQISYDSAAQNFNNHNFQVQQAENSVISAQLNLDKARAGGGDASATQSLLSAQLNVDQVKAKIAQSSLYAPIDGTILSVSVKPGDQAAAFATVITIGRPDPKEAVASIAITDAQKMSVGTVGVCQVLNHPETAVQCVVRRIPSTSKEADQTTRVAASLDNVAADQLIEVQMPLQVSKDVLWLPPTAIRTFQNRTFVVIQTADGPRSFDVVLGLQTTDRVEIKSGINEGDVAIGP
ncbi:MAG: HlyD family efflux transporter periplasmic adaptor subunit [Anaerolineaceae bacterium]|nr:HlyD family efflux transporter periplasmic adaptor subunit [Anaerolineaceae bacterium]